MAEWEQEELNPAVPKSYVAMQKRVAVVALTAVRMV